MTTRTGQIRASQETATKQARQAIRGEYREFRGAKSALQDAATAFKAAQEALAQENLSPKRVERLKGKVDAARKAYLAAEKEMGAQYADIGEARNRRDVLSESMALMPWMAGELLQVYVSAWIDNPDEDLALARTRQSPVYDKYFAGNRRKDGSLRMSEVEYASTWATFETVLAQKGVNPGFFQDQFIALIEGDVSVIEFKARVNAMEERVSKQEQQVKETYARYFGISMERGAMLAAALDPKVDEAIINRRISLAEIGGEAAIQGFMLTRGKAKSLYKTGIRLEGATELFRTAASALPGISGAARRQHEGKFGLSDFLGAQATGDVAEERRMRRILAGETSSFTERQFGAITESGGLSGLEQR